jgi:isopenicillin N synthase-like dioxygenase
VEYSQIPALDFSQYDQPGGIEKLTAQMKAAVEDTGKSTDSVSF